MKNIILFYSLIILISSKSYAQFSDGSVRSLVNAEEYFNFKVKKEGINKAFLKVIDPLCMVYRPNPVNAKEFYSKQKETDLDLNWKPEYAIISKSGDFGFTTGPYIAVSDGNINFGHYVSVWKADHKKRWKLVLDAGISHQKPKSILDLVYQDPSNHKYPKLMGPQKIKWREDIVLNTDILLGKSLHKSGNENLNEFYDTTVRLYFPNHLPIIGRKEAVMFLSEQKLNIEKSTPTFTDRAISGDLAYTYGTADVNSKTYHYIRLWKIDQDMKWNIVLDAYLP
jgi:hypothetical protein